MKKICTLVLILIFHSSCSRPEEVILQQLSGEIPSDSAYINNHLSEIDFTELDETRKIIAEEILLKGTTEQIAALFEAGLDKVFIYGNVKNDLAFKYYNSFEVLMITSKIDTLEFLIEQDFQPRFSPFVLKSVSDPEVFSIIEMKGFSILDTYKKHFGELSRNKILLDYLLNHPNPKQADFVLTLHLRHSISRQLDMGCNGIVANNEFLLTPLFNNHMSAIKKNGFSETALIQGIFKSEYPLQWHVLLNCYDPDYYADYITTLEYEERLLLYSDLLEHYQTSAERNEINKQIFDTIIVLAKSGIDINTRSTGSYRQTALSMALKHGKKEYAQEYLSMGAAADAMDLYHAVDKKFYDLIEQIIDSGVNPNEEYLIGVVSDDTYQNYSKGTALHKALWNADIKAVELLISKGADVNQYNIYRNYNYKGIKSAYLNPTAIASLAGGGQLYNMLLDAGAYPPEGTYKFDITSALLDTRYPRDLTKNYQGSILCQKELTFFSRDNNAFVEYAMYNLYGYIDKLQNESVYSSSFSQYIVKFEADNTPKRAETGVMKLSEFLTNYAILFTDIKFDSTY